MQAVLPVYLLVAVGMLLHRLAVMTKEMEKGMLHLVIHCLYPCLILDKTLGNPLVRDFKTVGWGIGLGCGLVLCGMLISWIVGSLIGLKAGTGKRTFTFAGGVQNYGYTAFPILAALFATSGDDAVLGVLFIHSLGVEIAIWVIGLMVMTGSFLKNPKLLINGPIVAVILGVILSWTGGWQLFQADTGGVFGGIVRQTISWLGACAFPLGVMLIGATMMDLAGKEKLSLRIGVSSLLVRLLIMPLIFLSAAKYLPIATALKQVLLVQAAMPAAVTPIMVARHYGGSPGVAVQTVIVTSVAALITMPLWISWGLKFVFP